jgi:hypothetical protein
MSQQPLRAGPPGGGPARRGAVRLAAAGGLLALVAAGLRGAVTAPSLAGGQFRQHRAVLGIVMEIVLGCLLVALVVRHRRAPRDAVLAARLRRLLTWVVVIALVAIPLGYVPLEHLKVTPRAVTPQQSARPGRQVLPHEPPGGVPVAVIIVLAVLAALAAAALVYLLVRLAMAYRRRGPWRRVPAGVPLEASAAKDEPALRDAVESGYDALRWLDDARAAIIACYEAMEASLARAGAVRAVADTPDELLVRAAGQGLVRGGAAATLTGLFYEARFSSHPMPRARRDDAERALRGLAASLGSAEPAGPDAQGAGGAAL